jgi:hypothetical protein
MLRIMISCDTLVVAESVTFDLACFNVYDMMIRINVLLDIDDVRELEMVLNYDSLALFGWFSPMWSIFFYLC